MCYNIETHLENTLKRARHYGDEEWIRRIEEALEPYKLNDYYQVSGYLHPEILIYTNEDPYFPKPAKWGLIPSWIKDLESANSIMNKTLNARGESIFEKPSFRNSAKSKRCVINVKGFYEYHHKNGKAYPYYIFGKDQEELNLGGLWEEWVNKSTGELYRTFSIVTTKANPMMAEIHNNPKLKEARMPFILTEEQTEIWLSNENGVELNHENIISTQEAIELEAYTVARLTGKDSPGNTIEATKHFIYPELSPTLF